jgi:hypothetical protein
MTREVDTIRKEKAQSIDYVMYNEMKKTAKGTPPQACTTVQCILTAAAKSARQALITL